MPQFGTKLWNAARFAEMDGLMEPFQWPTKRHKWIIGETAKVREVVDAAFDLSVQRCGASTLCLCLGQGLRLVCEVKTAGEWRR